MKFNFYVTGASGWVGSSFLHELQKFIPRDEFNSRVKCFSSCKKLIKSTNYDNPLDIVSYPLEKMPEFISGEKNLKIFHTAFITREKVNDYGINEYISKNKEIISTVKESISKASNVQIVIISSGAASKFDYKNPDTLDYQNDPYESLKWLEEKTLGNLCNSLILRIYALSGKFLRDPDVLLLETL